MGDLDMVESEVKISVIIPVYNSEQYLKKCLDSIVSQKYQNWEAFVIDDASHDNSFKIMSNYAKKDSRIKVFRNARNQGPGRTRNIALEYVFKSNNLGLNNKEYIVFIDSDDWVEEEYFLSISHIADRKDSDVIFVDIIQEDATGNFIKSERMSAYKGKPKETIIRHQMTGKMPWGGVRKAVKKDLLIKKDIKYSEDEIGEEALYSFKLLYYAKRIEFIDKSLYHYVIHPNSQSGSYNNDPYGPICEELGKYMKKINVYEKYKNTLVSFAFTALIVSIYRSILYYGFNEAVAESKLALKKYRQAFGFNLDKDSLEPRVRFVLPFAKLNFVLPILLLGKAKTHLNSRKYRG